MYNHFGSLIFCKIGILQNDLEELLSTNIPNLPENLRFGLAIDVLLPEVTIFPLTDFILCVYTGISTNNNEIKKH